MPKIQLVTRFGRDKEGNVAIIFALSLIPIFGFIGASLDYVRAVKFRAEQQTAADMAALTGAAADDGAAQTGSLNQVRTRLQATHINDLTNLNVTSAWSGGSDYKVTVTGDLKTYVIRAAPGMPESMRVSAEATARRVPATYVTEAPKLSELSPEAGDYNRIYLYCYNEMRKNDADKGRRAETMVPIADNGGTKYDMKKIKACTNGETVSYRLRNVRMARATPKNWDKDNQEIYDYYTDTTIDPGTRVQVFNMKGERFVKNGSPQPLDMVANPIVETILCDTESQCRSRNDGGILPNNNETNRTPQVATSACTETKFLYFGWEDRPPNGGSDRDYDDIRIVVNCPKMIKISDKQVRLIK